MKNAETLNVKKAMNLKLAPETIRIRDAIIDKYLEEPLDTLSQKLQSLINDETDTATRLGILSARVEILRMRFANITERAYKKDAGKEDSSTDEGADDLDEKDSEVMREGWMTLKMLEPSEVNGVRFPEGVKIDVHAEDAKKLLEANKAELMSVSVEELQKLDKDLGIVEEETDNGASELDSEKTQVSSQLAFFCSLLRLLLHIHQLFPYLHFVQQLKIFLLNFLLVLLMPP